MTEYKVSGSFIQAIANDRATKWIAAGTFIVAVGFSISSSWISGLLILAGHAAGFLLCYLLKNQIYRLGFFLSAPKPEVPLATPRSHHCSVCGNNQCGRHKPVARGSHKTSLPEQVDHALQLLLDQILEQYIERWHIKVTEDPDFEQELRFSMQNAISALLHRINQVDETLVVTERLLPAAMAHFDALMRVKPLQVASPEEEVWHTAHEMQGICTTPIQEDISKQWPLGDAPESLLPWHPATFSRRHEIAYLRHLTLKLLPTVLLPHQLSCKAWSGLVREIIARWVLLPAMDLLADGAVILKLLERLLNHSSLLPPYSASSHSVPTLQNFVLSHAVPSASRLRVGLSNVLKEPQLLYHFMQFLKKAGTVHVLQFCLDLEKFNDRMLEPDLSDSTLVELYQEAWDLFSLYFSPNSPDCVNFPAGVVHDMKSVLEGGEKNVLKLRNTPPLFQAFEFAYAKLEQDLLPQFHHSDDYFIMLCGGRLGTFKKKKSPRLRGEEGSGSGSWSKLATDSAAYAEIRQDVWDSGDSPRGMSSHKNLSAWRVSVPRVYLRPDMPGSTRITAVMVIAVQRIDIQEDDDPAECGWTVYRTHADFCALASKLQEFHGEFDQVECTPLKRPLTRGLEALEAWRADGEEYLQALLHTPALQNSDLLCAFLSPDIDFAEIAGGSDLSLAKVLRTVRLRKENGQHLEPFISNLIAVTKRKPRNHKSREEKEESPPKPVESVKKLYLKHAVFGDNLGLKYVSHEKILNKKEIEVPSSVNSWPLRGMFDSIIYLVVRMFGASNVLVQICLAVRHLFRGVIDSFYQRKLSDKLHRALGPSRIVFLINLLRDELSGQRGSSSRLSFDQEVQTAQQVLQHLERLLPWPLTRLPHTHSALTAMLRTLRTPLLNKQLAYTLLDIIVEELYPELRSANNDK